MTEPDVKPPAHPSAKPLSGPQKALHKLGLVRDIEALEEMEFELLTERRRHHPRGAAGGEPGQTGRNLLVDADGTATELEPKTGGHLGPGQRLRIETPGGGGFGEPR